MHENGKKRWEVAAAAMKWFKTLKPAGEKFPSTKKKRSKVLKHATAKFYDDQQMFVSPPSVE